MNLKLFAIIFILFSSALSGCLEEEILESLEQECVTLPAGHEDDGKLRILTYDVLALNDSMIDQFESFTGIEVEFIKETDSGGILDQMMLTKEAQQADLMIGLDNSYLQTAIDNCLLRETLFTQNPQYDNISNSALEPYQGKLAIPFDQGTVCLNYDENFVDGENITVPTSLWNLTETQWNGKTVFPSPLSSSPGRAFMLATIDYFENDGDDQTDAFDWWSEMENNGATFTSGWSEAYETHYTGGYGEYTVGHIGDSHLTVSYCHSPGVEAFYSSNWTHSTSLILPKSTYHQVEYTGIINGAANVAGAESFIEYLLSNDVNTMMPENNLMYSVLENSSLPETDGFRFHSDIATQNAEIPLERIELNMELWLSKWKTSTQ
ncbi:MAG: thiamine ABC transporter substrate-binding protein [Candidatus Poseidoniales archaeon]|nr:MAG: thiamine ABC transporter substrate-binding protein [Candidatus Poseidoniales archaeon]|tara:strand:+ start:7899 stop:9035 length:1137 start_codon:yes stop_codon:yes gene_type:complete